MQSAVYMVIGLIAGAQTRRGPRRRAVMLAARPLAAVAFGAIGCAAALRTGSGEAVQGLFPLFFMFIFLSSSSLPRNLLTTGWFHTVATWNPVSYLIEGFRSLYIVGWDSTALLRGFAVASGSSSWPVRRRPHDAHEDAAHMSTPSPPSRLARAREHLAGRDARSPGARSTPTCAGPTCSSPRCCSR